MRSFTLELPLFVGGTTRTLKDGQITKPTKKFWLTMNNYRNWHYQICNNTKVLFKKKIDPQIKALPDLTALWGPVAFHYVLFEPDKRSRDLMNYVSVIDKYFQDALVEAGKLEDDNLSFVPTIKCKVGQLDKVNPRMEVTILQD